MKIGIITLISRNYGNRLQNYAVQELLSKFGDVSTVRFEWKNSTENKKTKKTITYYIDAIDNRMINIYHISNRKNGIIKRLLYLIIHRRELKRLTDKREQAFNRFDERYITYEDRLLHINGDDSTDWVGNYDKWVCGSDQIWNPTYPTATRIAFLQFADKDKRVALSPSFGVGNIEQMPLEYSRWISEIPSLSVREERGAEIVEQLTGKKAEILLDPTMLIPTKKWEEMADASSWEAPDQFNVSYFLGIREKEYVNAMETIGGDKQLVDILCGEALDYFSMGPDDVVKAIRNADFVFVDSFHGAVFSILFHKDFVVFERSENGSAMNTRLQTLLKRFGLEDRVYSKDNLDKLRKPIDYRNVEAILERERNTAFDYLSKALSTIPFCEDSKLKKTRAIYIHRTEQCYGCSACTQICPKQCISMEPDAEGFYYPKIDSDKCINCGKCVSICPMECRKAGNTNQKVFACKNNSAVIRDSSSSGGVFYSLGKWIIQNGGVVVGCAFNEKMKAKHCFVETVDGLESLKQAKYVQSDLCGCMRRVQEELNKGRKVLFSGTPCQVAGLLNFLGKDYKNLTTVDVLCHGVPSPGLFQGYLDEMKERYGKSKIDAVSFKNKQHGWKRQYTEIKFSNNRRYYDFNGYDQYVNLFLKNMSLRPTCYECRFTKSIRYGDISLGDFWGIGNKYPEWDDDRGISLVLINSEKGRNLFEKVNDTLECREESVELAQNGQATLRTPPSRPRDRDAFYICFANNGYKEAMDMYSPKRTKCQRIFDRIILQLTK